MSSYDEDEIMEDPPSFEEDIGVPLDDEDMEDQVTKLLMPSPSADSRFALSILKFFKHAQFFMYTQNHFGILKS